MTSVEILFLQERLHVKLVAKLAIQQTLIFVLPINTLQQKPLIYSTQK